MKTVVVSSLRQLEGCSQKQLDELFAKGSARNFPDGGTDGVVLLQPFFVKKFGELVWKGKSFDAKKGELSNRIAGLRLIRGKLRKGRSLFDSEPCIVIDYRTTSFVASNVIDELREVGKGVFLGRAYRNGVFFANFALKERE